MRVLSSAFVLENNALNSSHPLTWLAELTPGAGPVQRLTNERSDIVFHTLTFTSRPFWLEQWGEGTIAEPFQLRAAFGNANHFADSLKEQYWRGVIHPLWTVTLWLIDAASPDDVALASTMGTYRITNLDLTDIVGLADLQQRYLSAPRTMSMRRFTPAGGFPLMRTV